MKLVILAFGLAAAVPLGAITSDQEQVIASGKSDKSTQVKMESADTALLQGPGGAGSKGNSPAPATAASPSAPPADATCTDQDGTHYVRDVCPYGCFRKCGPPQCEGTNDRYWDCSDRGCCTKDEYDKQLCDPKQSSSGLMLFDKLALLTGPGKGSRSARYNFATKVWAC